jgi:hypothetical protein
VAGFSLDSLRQVRFPSDYCGRFWQVTKTIAAGKAHAREQGMAIKGSCVIRRTSLVPPAANLAVSSGNFSENPAF